jgi:hypothetical protein
MSAAPDQQYPPMPEVLGGLTAYLQVEGASQVLRQGVRCQGSVQAPGR